jgi:hypothetical protein
LANSFSGIHKSKIICSAGVGDSHTQQVGEFSFKHSIADSTTQKVGESIFDYEYFRDFDAKIGTAGKVV